MVEKAPYLELWNINVFECHISFACFKYLINFTFEKYIKGILLLFYYNPKSMLRLYDTVVDQQRFEQKQ